MSDVDDSIETFPVVNGWFARNGTLRLTAWGADEKDAEAKLVELETIYYECLARSELVPADRVRGLHKRIINLMGGTEGEETTDGRR